MRIECPECHTVFVQEPNNIFCPHCSAIADPGAVLKKTLKSYKKESAPAPAPKPSSTDTSKSRIFGWKK